MKSISNKENRCGNAARKKMSVIQSKWDRTLGSRLEGM